MKKINYLGIFLIIGTLTFLSVLFFSTMGASQTPAIVNDSILFELRRIAAALEIMKNQECELKKVNLLSPTSVYVYTWNQENNKSATNILELPLVNIEYTNFNVLEGNFNGTCRGECFFSINDIDCGPVLPGFNELPLNCVEALDNGLNIIKLTVKNYSFGGLSDFWFKAKISHANC